MTSCRTCLSMDRESARPAAELWTSLTPDSAIENITALQGQGDPVLIDLTLAGTGYQILGAGGMGEPTMASSFTLVVPGQAELDRFWDGILDAGGQELECAWIRDPYGFFWQVLPQVFADATADPSPAVRQAAVEVIWTQTRVDAEAVSRAVAAARRGA